jgi:hypothetical protein
MTALAPKWVVVVLTEVSRKEHSNDRAIILRKWMLEDTHHSIGCRKLVKSHALVRRTLFVMLLMNDVRVHRKG